MGEMNNCNNPYAAYSCSGGRRDADHSPRDVQASAWKRAYLIMHGGDVAAINARLAALRPARACRPARSRSPQPQIAFVWAPMTGGAPNISALRPQVYWPGRRWVDWVGTSFYSRFPNFTGLDRFYKDFARRQAQAVRDRRVGDLGRGRAGLRRPAVRLDRHPQAGEDGPLQPGRAVRRDLPAGHYPDAARVIRSRLRARASSGTRPSSARVDPASERRRDHAPVGRRRRRVTRSRPAGVIEAKMPRRSSAHMARQASPSSSSRATTREHVLCAQVDRVGELLHAHLALATLAEPLEHLVLDRREVVLALAARTPGPRGRRRGAAFSARQAVDRIGGGVGCTGHARERTSCIHGNQFHDRIFAIAYDALSCVSPPQPLPRIPAPSTGARGSPFSCCAASCSSTGSTSRWSAWRSPASTPTSTSPPRRCSGSSAATCSATAACCCSAAAPPTCSAGAASCSIALAVFAAASLLGALVDSGPLLIAARFIKGAAAGVHRAGRPVDHHDDVPRGPGCATARWASTRRPAPAGSRSGSCSAAC